MKIVLDAVKTTALNVNKVFSIVLSLVGAVVMYFAVVWSNMFLSLFGYGNVFPVVFGLFVAYKTYKGLRQ